MHIYLLSVSVNNTVSAGADASSTNKKVIFINCAPFTNCISKIKKYRNRYWAIYLI